MKKRTRSLIIVLVVLLLVSVAIPASIWFVIAQPLFFDEYLGSDFTVEPQLLENHVRMLSETCSPRDYAHPENLDCAAVYIRKMFEKTGGLVEEQIYHVDGVTYKNILVKLGPQKGERIIIGAHYDVYKPYPGANDDASGIAALIELAFLLDNIELSRPVELVAFTLEEPPFYNTEFMGSYIHAESIKASNTPVKLMIAIDEIGYYSDEPKSQSLPVPSWLKGGYSTVADFVAIIGPIENSFYARSIKAAMTKATDLPVYSFTVPVDWERMVLLGDHRNYWKTGVPALIITDTAFLRSNVKHSLQDTADTLDYQRMAKVVLGLFEAIRTMAE